MAKLLNFYTSFGKFMLQPWLLELQFANPLKFIANYNSISPMLIAITIVDLCFMLFAVFLIHTMNSVMNAVFSKVFSPMTSSFTVLLLLLWSNYGVHTIICKCFCRLNNLLQLTRFIYNECDFCKRIFQKIQNAKAAIRIYKVLLLNN